MKYPETIKELIEALKEYNDYKKEHGYDKVRFLR